MRFGMKRRKRAYAVVIFTAAAATMITICALLRFHTAYVNAAHAYANGIATSAISDAVRQTFEKYGEGEFLKTAGDGDVTLFETDTAKVNLISSELTENLQKRVPLENYTTMRIPLGTITGIAALSAWGIKVPVRIHPVNLVNTDIDEVFESCGINQVRHSVTVKVEIVLSCSGFMLDEDETVRMNVPVTDTVIVGDTPKYYGSAASLKPSE